MTDEPIRSATVREYRQQIADAVENLNNGHVATFSRPGYAITYYLREIARDDKLSGELEHDANVPPPMVLYATWHRDWITGDLRTGEVLRFSIDAERRAAVMAYALLENLTQEVK